MIDQFECSFGSEMSYSQYAPAPIDFPHLPAGTKSIRMGAFWMTKAMCCAGMVFEMTNFNTELRRLRASLSATHSNARSLPVFFSSFACHKSISNRTFAARVHDVNMNDVATIHTFQTLSITILILFFFSYSHLLGSGNGLPLCVYGRHID